MANTLPMLSLSGIAVEEDKLAKKRAEFWTEFEQNFVQRDASETLDTLIDRVKTPPKPAPDRRDPAVFSQMFEESNRDLKLYFTTETMDGFYDLLADIALLFEKQGMPLPSDYEWSTKVGELEQMIEQISNPYTQRTVLDRFIKLVAKARKTPNDRAHSFNVIRTMVGRVCEQVVDMETKIREEAGAIPLEVFRVPPEDETEEQRWEHLKAQKAAQAEALKKLKKKPKTEEEEAQELKEITEKTAASVSERLCSKEVDRAERQIKLLETKWLIDNHQVMDEEMWDTLNRKVSVLDIDIAEQEVILRTDIDVQLSPYVPLPPIEEEFKAFFDAQKAEESQSSRSKKKKKNKK